MERGVAGSEKAWQGQAKIGFTFQYVNPRV